MLWSWLLYSQFAKSQKHVRFCWTFCEYNSQLQSNLLHNYNAIFSRTIGYWIDYSICEETGMKRKVNKLNWLLYSQFPKSQKHVRFSWTFWRQICEKLVSHFFNERKTADKLANTGWANFTSYKTYEGNVQFKSDLAQV